MGSFGPLHWIVVAIVAILLLGGGRFSNLMGDVAKGVKSFKKGLDDDDETVATAKPIENRTDMRVERADEKSKAT